MSLGVLREPRAACDRVALRRPTAMAAGARRAHRGRRPVRGTRLHAVAWGPGAGSFPPPLRDAVPTGSQGAFECHLARVPRGCRCAPQRARVRVARVPCASARELHDDATQLARVLGGVPGIDAAAIVGRIDDPEVVEAYERDKAETRSAAGSAAELQGKTRITDGPVRFTAPTVAFERDGVRMVAGGFQPVEAYDVLIANLDPTLHRESAPDSPEPLLERFTYGLTTQEVAALLCKGNDAPDRGAAEEALLELVAGRRAVRVQLGDDALWRPASAVSLRAAA